MLERTQARMLPLAGRAADHAPMAAVCCNACRACATTNLLSLGLATAAGAGAFVVRAVRRTRRRA
jgi:hypothetical protein